MNSAMLIALDEYQNATQEFAVYPSDQAIQYLCLGLVDESSELFEAAVMAGSTADSGDLIDELGDVCWYSAQLALRLGLRLSEMIAERRDFVQPLATLSDAASFIMLKSAEIAGPVKKMMRGDKPLEQSLCAVKARASESIAQIMMVIDSLAVALGRKSVISIALANLEKLRSRAQRGVIKGSGGSR